MAYTTNIIVTGAAGFIGSCLVGFLNEKGFGNLILVDDFSRKDKQPNLEGKIYRLKVEREQLFEFLQNEKPFIDFVYHLGARTDTTEFDYSVHEHLNVEYSKKVWNYCSQNQVPLVYASSAATYGSGEMGYEDDEKLINELHPLNPYGVSKNEFDKWVLIQNTAPPAWSGLKFFNVYGPNEYHKGRMASVIFHSFNQIKEQGFVKLFKSHKEGYEDGEQKRDFIYVKDILKICFWFLECWQNNPATFAKGIFNAGTGLARTFNDLVKSTFTGIDLPTDIEYIDMPEDLRNTYQYFTEATMQKIREAGYNEPFFTLEEGVDDYVRNFLCRDNYY